jgi:hypothetical protein
VCYVCYAHPDFPTKKSREMGSASRPVPGSGFPSFEYREGPLVMTNHVIVLVISEDYEQIIG